MEHELFLKNKFNQVARLIKPNTKVLDIGCNDGNIRNFLPKNIIYYGVDIDREFIQDLKNKNINAEQADLNKDEIPFQNEKFDYILLLDIIEHVVNPKDLLEQSKNKLKPNGRIIITLPNDYHILNKLRFITNKHLTEDPFAPYGHLHFFPIKTGENLLKQAGFKILKKISIPPTKPLKIPQSIKNFLGKNFPQSFARDILYLLEVEDKKNREDRDSGLRGINQLLNVKPFSWGPGTENTSKEVDKILYS